MTRRTVLIVLTAGIPGALVVLVIAWIWNGSPSPSQDTSSCANGFIYLSSRLRWRAESDPGYSCPVTADTAEALADMIPELGRTVDEVRNGANACPESFRRDGTLGYVYVGDDLRLADAVAGGFPILMCPAGNHQGDEGVHSHAFPASKGWLTCANRSEMISILREALGANQEGRVRYSDRAIAVLESELRARCQEF